MRSKPEVTGARPGPAVVVPKEMLPDREVRSPLLRYFLHLGLPVSVSLIIHLGVLAFLALKVFDLPLRDRIEVGQWQGSVVAAEELGSGLQWPDETVLDTLTEAPSLDFYEKPTAFRPGDVDLGALDNRAPGSPGDSGGLGLGDGTLSLLGTGSGAGEPGTGGFGGGLGGGGARIGQAGIWNVNVRANKIVYVVDFSGSITVAVADLKRELKRSIGRLTPAQSFNVIIFYSAAGGPDEIVRTESFKSKLEPANKETRAEFLRWIDRKAPRGETLPLQAVQRALALQPDAVFFFSDGYFDDAVVGEIEWANRAVRARIYCLVFDEILLEDTSGLPRETEGVRRLKRIAEGNGGRVKVVTGKDLGQ